MTTQGGWRWGGDIYCRTQLKCCKDECLGLADCRRDHEPGAAADIGAVEKTITYSSKARVRRESFMLRAFFVVYLDVPRSAKVNVFEDLNNCSKHETL